MAEQEKPTAFRRRHKLALQGVVLAVGLSVPVIMYRLAETGNSALLWGAIAAVGATMALAVWVG